MSQFSKIAIIISFALLSPVIVFASDQELEQQYSKSCGICHDQGVAGAPKRGDSEVWPNILAKGLDNLLASVKTGQGAMPPMGMCASCSDEDLKALIEMLAVVQKK